MGEIAYGKGIEIKSIRDKNKQVNLYNSQHIVIARNAN